MEDYLHQDLGELGPDDVVEVILDNPANVQLLDPANFEAYRERRPYRYADGGYVTKSPVRLYPPRKGRWHVVIDLGGGPGRVRASVVIPPSGTPAS